MPRTTAWTTPASWRDEASLTSSKALDNQLQEIDDDIDQHMDRHFKPHRQLFDTVKGIGPVTTLMAALSELGQLVTLTPLTTPVTPGFAATRRRTLGGLAALALLPGCASPSWTAPGSAALLAPQGRLRASINLGNPILATRDAEGRAVGVSVDLATVLAQQLGVALELVVVVVDAALKSVEAVTQDRADVGFFAIDPQRAAQIRFTAPYVLIEGAYLVRDASPLTEPAQVDHVGTRVMVGRGSAYDLYLSRTLKAATLQRAPTSPQVVDRFLAEQADVAAGVRQQLEADAQRLGGLRLLPGRFMVIEQAMGLPAMRGDAAAALLRDFVEWAKRSGLVAQALRRHGIEGADVAPPAG